MTIAKAVYRKTGVERYDGNPYIEALPPMKSAQEIMELFFNQPMIKEEDRLLDSNERLIRLGVIDEFLAPLEIHQEIYSNIYTMLCEGYVDRNPYKYEDLKLMRLNNKFPDLLISSQEFGQNLKKPAKSICPTRLLLGVSGIGKTTTIERLVQYLPQVIFHTEYKGRKMTRSQITYLKVDCPHNALTSTFCRQLLKAFDEALNTNTYERQAIINNHSFNTMISTIRNLIQKFGVGIILIDEVQFLIQDGKDSQELSDLFVSMINYLKVPIYFIGTPKFLKITDLNLRSKRRFNSEGLILWDRIKEDSTDWNILIKSLWELQLTRTFTPLTQELKQAFYEETQGILAFVTTLFKAVQRSLIVDLDNPDEIITPKIIHQVSRKVFSTYQNLLQAIRENNREVIESYEDLDFSVLNNSTTLAERIQDNTDDEYIKYQLQKKAALEEEVFQLLEDSLSSMDCFAYLKKKDFSQIAKEVIADFGAGTELKVLKQKCLQEALNRDQALEQSNQRKEKEKRIQKDSTLPDYYSKAREKKMKVTDLLMEDGMRGLIK